MAGGTAGRAADCLGRFRGCQVRGPGGLLPEPPGAGFSALSQAGRLAAAESPLPQKRFFTVTANSRGRPGAPSVWPAPVYWSARDMK
jgi:hypothetical protein